MTIKKTFLNIEVMCCVSIICSIRFSGLLKNHKGVSEFSTGMEENSVFKQSNNFAKRTFTEVSSERVSTKPVKVKVPKKWSCMLLR